MSYKWIEQMLNLQEIDLRIRELTLKLSLIPKEKKLIKDKATANIDGVNKDKLAIQKLELKLKNTEDMISSIDDSIKKLEQQSSLVKKNSEYQAMLHSIAEKKLQISDLDEKIILLLDNIEDKKKIYRKSNENLKYLNKSLKSEYQELDKLEKELKSMILELQKKREPKYNRVEKDLINRYESLLSKGVGKPLSQIQVETCENCHRKVTAHTVSSAKKTEVVYCDNCQHFLYLEEVLPII